jgi:hypothetical protein
LAAASLAAMKTTRGKRAPTEIAQGDRDDLRRDALHYNLLFAGYRNKASAQEAGRDLAKRGYRADVEEAGAGAYRVVVKNFASRDAARKAARSIGRTLKIEPVITASR